MLDIGFSQSVNDLVLYWKLGDDGPNFILVYIDNMLIFALSHSDSLHVIKEALSKEFKMKDMGELKSFLSIEVSRD